MSGVLARLVWECDLEQHRPSKLEPRLTLYPDLKFSTSTSDLVKVLPPLTALVVVNIYRKSLARSSGIPARLSDSLQFPSSI